MALTAKQQVFVDEYLIDLNATKAAIRAGYSKKTANEQASRLLTVPSVKQAIAEAIAKRSERTKIDADWVLTRLAAEATADIADLYDDKGALLPVPDWPLIWRQGLVAGLDVDEKFADGKKTGQVTKVKLSDRIKRIELIGKHVDVQAFAERKEIGGIGGGPIEVKDLSVPERARHVAFLLALGAESVKGGNDPADPAEAVPGAASGVEQQLAPEPEPEPERIELKLGEVALFAGYSIRCEAPQRDGLPVQYLVSDSGGGLLTSSAGGWQGALAYVRALVGDDNMSMRITKQEPSPEPPRADQRA